MGTTVFERRPPDPAVVRHSLAGTHEGVFWLEDVERPAYAELRGVHAADLVVVGGGYAGLWSAVRAKERDPQRRVILLEAGRIGWAASGRNGGFCDESLTHGEANGMQRWPDEMPTLRRLGRENLDAIAETVKRYDMNVEFERTGEIALATEEHQVASIVEEPGFLDETAVRDLVHSDTYLAGVRDPDSTALVHPARLALELARVAEGLGVEIHEHSLVKDVSGSGDQTVTTEHGAVLAGQVILATNVFPSLLRRNRLMTVPVYDYVLMSEPLSGDQLDDIGWRGREGLSDLGNQFHYYRRTADDRVLFGGYDAVYHYGGRVRPSYEHRPESFRTLAEHFFTTFPQLAGMRFTHAWAGAIDSCSRFCAFYGTTRDRRIAYAAGFTGLGVAATRFAADVMLDLLAGDETERTALEMVRTKPVPFPPEPAAAIGINLTRASMNRADHNAGKRNLLLKTLDALGMGFDS